MDLITVQDIRDEMLHYYDTGGGKRYYLGFKNMDAKYAIREGSRTDWTGYPGSGKTELMLECLWNCSNYYDHKHLIYMPDAGAVAEVVAKLFHKITGKQLETHYHDATGRHEVVNRANKSEIDRYLPEILHYFKIYNPPPKVLVSPKVLWDHAVEIQHTEKIFNAVIDSWNNMHHDTNGEREDKWLAKQLQYGNKLVEDTGLHFHTIIHPRSTRMKDGQAVMPTYHEMKGGSEWGNYGKSIIIVHRDNNVDYTDVSFGKVKGANIGVRGLTTIHYDVPRAKYYEIEHTEGGQRRYAQPEGENKTTPEPKPKELKPNLAMDTPKVVVANTIPAPPSKDTTSDWLNEPEIWD